MSIEARLLSLMHKVRKVCISLCEDNIKMLSSRHCNRKYNDREKCTLR